MAGEQDTGKTLKRYLHAVEDASVVLTHCPMGDGEKQRRLNPVERSQFGPISNPEFAGQN